jgi:hypothetical protein
MLQQSDQGSMISPFAPSSEPPAAPLNIPARPHLHHPLLNTQAALTKDNGRCASLYSSTNSCLSNLSWGSRDSRLGGSINRSFQIDGSDIFDPLGLEAGHHGLLVVRFDPKIILQRVSVTRRIRGRDLDLFHSLGAISVSHQHTATGGVGAPSLPAADVPSIAHHELEVIIFIDGG